METKWLSVLLALIALALQALSVSALRCAQCFSLVHEDCEDGGIKPTPCAGRYQDAKFCVKYVGQYSLGTLIWRDCELKNSVNNTCKTLNIRNEEVETCFSTCTTDGCNGAQSIRFACLNPAFLCWLLWFAHEAFRRVTRT